jgi:hypothetical protein
MFLAPQEMATTALLPRETSFQASEIQKSCRILKEKWLLDLEDSLMKDKECSFSASPPSLVLP